ncbi:hypothetical protein J6590_107687, partial [Homalodisca vitripennis]
WDSVPLEAQPAKRPSSPPAGSAPKKVAAPAKGLFKGHNVTTATVTSDQPTASVSTPRIPLLFLDSVPDWPTHAKKLEELARDGLTTTFRDAHYRLKVTTVEDFRAVQRYLCFNKLPFYTHNLGCECVRCGDNHLKMNCPKVSTEKGHCCNCGGDHNANYRGCPVYKEARAAAVQLGRKSRPTKPAAWRSTAQPPKRPARDESPANSVSESEAEDDMPQKKKRRRKPQNPANRLPRPPANTPATPPQQTEAPAADAAAEAAALAQRSLQA